MSDATTPTTGDAHLDIAEHELETLLDRADRDVRQLVAAALGALSCVRDPEIASDDAALLVRGDKALVRVQRRVDADTRETVRGIRQRLTAAHEEVGEP